MKKSVLVASAILVAGQLSAGSLRAETASTSLPLIEGIRDRVAEIRAQLDAERAARREAEVAAVETLRKVEAERDAAGKRASELAAGLSASEKRMEALQREIDQLNVSLTDTARALDEEKQARKTLTDSAAAKEKDLQDKLVSHLQASEKERTDFAKAAREMDRRIADLEKDLGAITQAMTAADTLAQQRATTIEEVTKTARQSADELASLEKQLVLTETQLSAEQNAARERAEQTRNTVAALQAQLAGAEKAAVEKAATYQKELDLVQEQARQEVARLQQAQQLAEKEALALDKELREIQATLDGIQAAFVPAAKGDAETLAAGEAPADGVN